MRLFDRTSAVIALVLLAAAFVAGCGSDASRSDDSDGGSTKGSGGGREVQVDDLEFGQYLSVGSDVEDKAGTVPNGRAVEAGRIAEVVVDPSSIDPSLQLRSTPSGAVATVNDLGSFLDVDPKLLGRRVSGAASGREVSDSGLGANVTVMTFETSALAARTADSISDSHMGNGTTNAFGGRDYYERTAIPGLPEVRASLYGSEPNTPSPLLQTEVAAGTALVRVNVSIPRRADVPRARQLAGRLISAQLDALDDFEPTPAVELVGLPVDTTGVAELTLSNRVDAKPEEPSVVRVWGPRGALHLQPRAGDLAEAFERAEMDVMAEAGGNGGTVYRAGSAKQAVRLLDDLDANRTSGKLYRAVDPPKGLPDAHCYQLAPGTTGYDSNVCLAQFGRYVMQGVGLDAPQAAAALSAQYLVVQQHG